MSVKHRILITGAAALTLSGCADVLGTRNTRTLDVSAAFQSVPVGFSANSNSFDARGDVGPFFPGSVDGQGKRDGMMGHGGPGGPVPPKDGFGGAGMRGMLMGGGLGPDFLGQIPFGLGKSGGPFGHYKLPDACTYSATSGRVTCPTKTRDGLTISMSFAFKDTAGVAQSKFDTTSTNSVNVKTSVTGTKTRRDSSVSVVDHVSDRTVSGMAPGSTARTVNGTAHATETTTGVKDSVRFTAVRVASDTTSGLVIPIRIGEHTIPTAGVVIRNMTVTITPDGGTAKTRSRREQITFDGTHVIKIVITQGDTTKNCTITLPDRRLSCE